MAHTAEGVHTASAHVIALVAELNEVKREEAALKRKSDNLRKQILDAMTNDGAHEYVDGDYVVVKRSLVARRTLDSDLVAKLAPKAYEKALKVSESWRVTLGK